MAEVILKFALCDSSHTILASFLRCVKLPGPPVTGIAVFDAKVCGPRVVFNIARTSMDPVGNLHVYPELLVQTFYIDPWPTATSEIRILAAMKVDPIRCDLVTHAVPELAAPPATPSLTELPAESAVQTPPLPAASPVETPVETPVEEPLEPPAQSQQSTGSKRAREESEGEETIDYSKQVQPAVKKRRVEKEWPVVAVSDWAKHAAGLRFQAKFQNGKGCWLPFADFYDYDVDGELLLTEALDSFLRQNQPALKAVETCLGHEL
jgi:hypothetical protein